MLNFLLVLALSPFGAHFASAQTEVTEERPKFEITGYGLVDRRRIPVYICRSTGGTYLGPQAPAYRIDYVIESIYGKDERMGQVKAGCYQVVETYSDGQPMTRSNGSPAFEP